jgi:hypothetical protein
MSYCSRSCSRLGPAALRIELDDPDIWPILEEAETGQRPEWKDIADCSPSTKATGPNGNPLLRAMAYYSATGNPLMIKITPDRSPSEQSERRADLTKCWTLRSSLGCLQAPGWGPGKNRCWEMILRVRHLCSQSRPPEEGIGAKCIVQHRGPIWKNSNRCSNALPMKRPRKLIPPIVMDYFTKWPDLCHF